MLGCLDGFGGCDMLPARMPRKFRAAMVALAVIILLARLGVLLFQGSQISWPLPLPNPNGYDDFAKAGKAVVGDVGSFSTLDQDSLRGLVWSNSEPLRLLRLGLTRRCSFPIEIALTNLSVATGDLPGLKRLALLLRAEGALAEIEGRPADAARDYTEAIRLGNEISRGGFVINRLVGITCEAIGGMALAKLPSLGCEQAYRILAEFESIDVSRVSFDEVRRNENRFARHEILKEHNPLNWITGWWEMRNIIQSSETRHKTVIAHERLLAAELALRCYLSQRGSVPARLDGLITNYLSRVPEDPFTERPLIYHPEGTNWLLYSVGSDGVDDGGRPAGRGPSAKGDLLFDSPW